MLVDSHIKVYIEIYNVTVEIDCKTHLVQLASWSMSGGCIFHRFAAFKFSNRFFFRGFKMLLLQKLEVTLLQSRLGFLGQLRILLAV